MDTAIQAAPWACFYAGVFTISRLLGPLLFKHVAALPPDQKSYWAESMVSVVNGLVLTPLAWQAQQHGSGVGFHSPNPISTMCCHAILGYTAWDTLTLIYYRKEWRKGLEMYFVHHTGSLAAWGIAATTGVGHNIVVPVELLEATSPFVNMRWFLSTAGYGKDSKLYIVNGIAMFISFFVLRVAFNWWLCIQRFYVQWADFAPLPLYFKSIALVLFPINLTLQMMWFSQILKGIIKIVFPPKDDKGKKAKKAA